MTTAPIMRRLMNGLFYYVHRFNKLAVKRTIKQGADLTTVFGEIYKRKYWQSGVFDESVSGQGSRKADNERYVSDVIALMRENGLARIFDCSCGDMNWVGDLVHAEGITYYGGDIVPGLIERNRATFGLGDDRLLVFDITTSTFPDVDVWHCKDTLFHLSYDNIFKALENFTASGIPWLLVTTQFNEGQFENRDIVSGNYRPLDLRGAPFHLGEAEAYIENGVWDGITKKSGLYPRAAVEAALAKAGR